MFPVWTSTIERSSLEGMLDMLRQRDEDEKPKDLPPALPARPTSKARLPPARRSLPNNFSVSDSGLKKVMQNGNGKEDMMKKEKNLESKRWSFGTKKVRKDQIDDSPYFVAAESDQNGQTESSNADPPSASTSKIWESDWDDNIGYFIKMKLHVWCQLPSRHWESGIIQSTTGEEAFVMLANGNLMKVSTEKLLPANPHVLEGVDDLVKLSYLNDPSVLYNIRKRYSQHNIYSKAGPVLIAVNPLKDVDLYGNDLVNAYRQKLLDGPHVYAVADAAYNEMMTGKVNQSIIISGESGAGKTETAKVAMQYLTVLGGGSCQMESRILKTNCILEAFGNAKTSKNDNSSRFGKLIEIHFSTIGKLCGAKLQTFLLEKSRVVHLANDERSYHIFYQLCAGASSVLKERLNLKQASEYVYLNQSDSMVINGVDDAQKFQILMEALDIIQICKEDQEDMFTVLAAILWLGNISFQANDGENHVEVLDDEALMNAAKLMGCSSQELLLVLSTRKIQAGKDTIAKKLTVQQAIDTRDALAKFIYKGLFDYIVEQINVSLEVGKKHTERSISILDIYGFESFKKNGFEQFCINYANERLQQHFNRHLLKLEQEDCELDGIDCIKNDIEDNQECLDLIEKKPFGVLALLDKESNFPKATDLNFANKLHHHLNANPCFKRERGRAFAIRHYAGEVAYDTNGFLEKNRDPFLSDSIQLLSSCNCKLPLLFATKMLNYLPKPEISSGQITVESQGLTVGTKYKGQLFKLMRHLENTSPHFIFCIKPNSNQVPGLFEDDLVLQQLRCSGVLEVVKISRSGYPTRVTHQEFAERYGFLLKEASVSKDPVSITIALLQQFKILPEMYQVGYTKLFLRKGQIGAMEGKRKAVLHGILGMQKCFRGHRARHYFHELKGGATILQSFVRGENARRKSTVMVKWSTACVSETIDELQAAIVLQSDIAKSKGKPCRKISEIKAEAIMEKMEEENAALREKVQEFEFRWLEYKAKIGSMEEIWQKEVKSLQAVQQGVQVQPTVLEELQKRVLKAEEIIEKKQKENAALQTQVQQYESRKLEYEAKMSSMEEVWKKQLASLQLSLAAARTSLPTDNSTAPPLRVNVNSPSYFYDSEDATSGGSRTPGGCTTPIKFSSISDVGTMREANGNLSPIIDMIKEFEQRRVTFDVEAKALVEVRSGPSTSDIKPDEELRQLKYRFEAWKKEYKLRLRATKAKLHKLGLSDEKSGRKWWGKLSSIAS